ncbi:Ser/Thr protein phosphatase [Histomonas meleagridis]|uniref:Ser/Thr protein phosphatase n=1 Tax=Histomonas meleagridis TaxID=135588 RepID=UPI00355AA423|nr:Ser/Thr protein phosphatase [Histomonas meleagridis]KAH0800618.1 Ser/Thr protein phosphatase [Histomonas meleagridis]
MPIAATVNDTIFCVHGGLSPSISDLSEVEAIEKPIPDLSCSIASDLLWSDPAESDKLFEKSTRGVGYLFNTDAIAQFLEDNQLKHIIRAHEFCENGFKWIDDDCLTVFSSFDYMGRKNDAAVAVVNGNDVTAVVLKKALNSAFTRLLMPEWLISGEESAMKAPVSDEIITDSVGLDTHLIVL